MKKRLYFNCWYCNREYSLFKEITDEQKLIVFCPYCEHKGVVELEPFKGKKITILRGDAGENEVITYEFHFPKLIPTRPPEESDES